MPFRRRGRPTWYFQALTRNGNHRSLSTGSSVKTTAVEVENMWSTLARGHRAWDVLERVEQGQIGIGALLDAWRSSRGMPDRLRHRLKDVDLALLAQEYLSYYESTGKREDTNQHVRHAIEWLLPPGKTLRSTEVSTAWLAEKLASYPASPSTRRKVRSEWNGLFEWLVDVKELLEQNPLRRVKPPALPPRRIEFYELDTVERIVFSQPTEERRALFALMYGSGIEVSTALRLTRENVLPNTKEVRAPGTKAHTRDRMVRVSDWAWEAFWGFAKLRLHGTLFSAKWRHTVSDWHRTTVVQLNLPERLPLKNARHHWAATRFRASAPIQVVQRQLGHASPTLTLNTYGPFLPTSRDHDRIEDNLLEYEKERRSAMDGAR